MPFETFNPPVRQSPGTKDAPEIKVLSAEFGDGYTQESPDGPNNVRSVVSMKWDVLLEDQATAIYDFLRARAKDANPDRCDEGWVRYATRNRGAVRKALGKDAALCSISRTLRREAAHLSGVIREVVNAA